MWTRLGSTLVTSTRPFSRSFTRGAALGLEDGDSVRRCIRNPRDAACWLTDGRTGAGIVSSSGLRTCGGLSGFVLNSRTSSSGSSDIVLTSRIQSRRELVVRGQDCPRGAKSFLYTRGCVCARVVRAYKLVGLVRYLTPVKTCCCAENSEGRQRDGESLRCCVCRSKAIAKAGSNRVLKSCRAKYVK
jgi:hypothetical protein